MFPFALCKEIKNFDGLVLEDYGMQPKVDGIRIQLSVDHAYTRTGHDVLYKIPRLVGIKDGAVLDGELVYWDDKEKPNFQRTASIINSKEIQKDHKQLIFIAFDILYWKQDLRSLSQQERESRLIEYLQKNRKEGIKTSPLIPVSEINHEQCVSFWGEGSVLKKSDAPYTPGKSKNWLKRKQEYDADVVITGFDPGAGKYASGIGAVRFGQYKDGVLIERGRCSGMTDEQRNNVKQHLGEVLTIKHNGITQKGGFRHPQWKALRYDKTEKECVWDEY